MALFHYSFTLCVLVRILLAPASSPFDIKETDLYYKTYMLKPNSWIHFLFLKKNRFYGFLHIKQNAIIIISFWIYFIINTVLSSIIIYLELNELDYFPLKISVFVVAGIFLLIVLIVNIILVYQSKKIYEIDQKLTQKEHDEIVKEIEQLVPHFYDNLPKCK